MADNVISKIKLPDNQEYILKDSNAARSNHTHTTSLAEDSTGTSSVSLKAGTKYKLTSGETSYTFTTPADSNDKVTQTATTTSANYEILFSGTADNTNHTEGARKTSTLTYNPSTKDLSTGGKINGYTLAAASARSVDNEIGNASTSTNLPTSKAVAAFVEGKGYVTSSGVTQVGTGAGLTGGTITGTGTIKANLTSETKLTNAAVDGTETAGRVYPVRLDKDGKLAVNVPWINTNGSYLTGVTTTGSGNAITAVEKNDQSLTFTKGITFLTEHRTYTKFTGNPTSNQTPAFGSTFTVQQISQATTGQVSGTDRTVTIPGTIAQNNVKGLIKPWYNHTKASTGPTAGSDATAVAVNAISNTAGKYYAVEIDSDGRLFANVPWTDTNTHHQAKLIVGATSTATENAAVTANSIYANVIENNQVRSSNNIAGSGSVTVSSDANGKITIAGTKSGTVTSITPGNGLLNGTGTGAITTSGTLNINYGTSVSNVNGNGSAAGTANTVSRSDHTHKIEIDEGTNNGEISIAGVTVKPKGIAALAYKASLVAGDIPNLPWSKITSGKPTTLSGYGITDAKIDGGVITLGSDTIKPVTSVNGHTGSVVNVTAADLGLASALKYVGSVSSLPAATNATTYSTYNNGDVITVNYKEYAYVKGTSASNSSWTELGDEGSYKTKQAEVTSATAETNTATTFVYSVTQNANGVIAVKTRPLPSYSASTHTHDGRYLKLDGSNNMTADVNIIAGDTDKFVNFWYNTNKTAGASWRIGYLGSGTGEANYFVIQSGTSNSSATAWNNALRIGANTFDVHLSSTTASASTTTGALTVEGGAGVKGQLTATRLAANGSNTSYNLYVNGLSYLNGNTYGKAYVLFNSNAVDCGSFLAATRGTAPTATTTDGTTTYSGAVIGTSVLTLGNSKIGANTASGVNDNAKGYLRIYGANSGYGELNYNDAMFASNKSIYLYASTNSGISNEIRGLIATNDYWRVAGGATESNAGYMEIATADDSTEPIYVRQYSGVFTTLKRTATLLDASGNTEFPGEVTASKFIGHASNDLALTGGKMTGRIYREGVSTGWNKGRDNALVATSSISGYSPFASIKTTNGSWDIGAYDTGPSYNDDLIFSYVPDTVYNGTNTTPTQIKFLENGHIVAALDGNATSATTATNLANKPSLAVSDTSKITVTAGGKTSDAFTVPYATSAGSAAAATTATNLSAAPTITATGTATVNLAANTAYTLTVGGKSVVFKTPSDANTNTLVNYTLGETTKAYLMASQNAPTTTTTARAAHGDTGVYLTATAGEFSAVRHSYNVAGAERAYTHYNMTDQSIDFVFV